MSIYILERQTPSQFMMSKVRTTRKPRQRLYLHLREALRKVAVATLSVATEAVVTVVVVTGKDVMAERNRPQSKCFLIADALSVRKSGVILSVNLNDWLSPPSISQCP